MADLKVGSADAAQPAPSQPGQVAQPFRAVADEARANRPERKALEFRIDAAAERVVAASAGSLPVLSAIGGYDFARPNPRIFPIQESVEAVVGSRRQRALAASLTAAAPGQKPLRQWPTAGPLEARLRDFDAIIDLEIRQRDADLRSAQASVEAARSACAPPPKRAACWRNDSGRASRPTPMC